ncbi:MAG: type II toxin-antitoxin system VapC family toxin [Planctomycetes bacterium]|nr:type II toxin-antitoxin system VapC family toxin [Planctomycetota bacterium]
MAGVLLDSDVIIWCLRGRQDALARVEAFAQTALPACSALSVAEVESGMKSGEELKTRAFLSAMEVRPVDAAVASEAARRIRHWRARGRTLTLIDACIAATCLLHGFQLATFNRRHYPFTDLTFASL